MKRFFKSTLASIAMLSAGCGAAVADATYAYTNPTFLPTAISAPAAFTTTGDYTLTTHGIGTVSMRITGTCTNLAAVLQGTNDNSNWSTINAIPVGGGANVAAFSTAGFWTANSAGFSKVRLHITALSASCTVAMAGTQGAPNAVADLCQNSSVAKSSVAVNVGASTTAALVAASTGKTTYLCSFTASAVGTNPTMTLKYGTQTTNPCDTGAASITGDMIPAAAAGVVSLGSGSTVGKTAASTQLCLTTGATTSIQGVATYVQQ